MPKWYFKAALQRGISLLPYSHRINHWVQRRMGTLQLSSFFLEDRLIAVKRHLDAARSCFQGAMPQKMLEVGTGWYPVVPIGLFLSGVEEVWSMDVRSLSSLAQIRELVLYLSTPEIKALLNQHLGDWDKRKFQALQQAVAKSPTSNLDRLSALGIHFKIGDARSIPIDWGKFDWITSNNTFEHIPEPVLVDMLSGMYEVVESGGGMSHYIDMVDHYHYADPEISPIHFLRFSANQWSWVENSLHYQNRLRLSEYRACYARAGVPIHHVDMEHLPEDALNAVNLHPQYQDLPQDDLLVGYASIVSRK
ncbi:class I SAM-dependent methyltransferase [Pontibacter sp. G13]|uniref:class I SAM-dependent methyltransferase n=1 Tax=Pontibacter sp. G13 TaxID=3074898 RepID=UPI00288914D1|nr:class I SAM-dependent methyltransferase [Pontibacter sp. G13]WNJ18645.1 class I SAM-dependent methyltransferase [Pontibacter sp. G13]